MSEFRGYDPSRVGYGETPESEKESVEQPLSQEVVDFKNEFGTLDNPESERMLDDVGEALSANKDEEFVRDFIKKWDRTRANIDPDFTEDMDGMIKDMYKAIFTESVDNEVDGYEEAA